MNTPTTSGVTQPDSAFTSCCAWKGSPNRSSSQAVARSHASRTGQGPTAYISTVPAMPLKSAA